MVKYCVCVLYRLMTDNTWGVPFVRIGCVLHLRETAILDNGWINVMCACIRMLAGYQEDDTQDIKENVYVLHAFIDLCTTYMFNLDHVLTILQHRI